VTACHTPLLKKALRECHSHHQSHPIKGSIEFRHGVTLMPKVIIIT